MIEHHINDNIESAPSSGTASRDTHGQVALLLVESLIHGLLARSVISVHDAVEVVEVASAVREMLAIDRDESPEALRTALRLLGAISTSLSADLPPVSQPGTPRRDD